MLIDSVYESTNSVSDAVEVRPHSSNQFRVEENSTRCSLRVNVVSSVWFVPSTVMHASFVTNSDLKCANPRNHIIDIDLVVIIANELVVEVLLVPAFWHLIE